MDADQINRFMARVCCLIFGVPSLLGGSVLLWLAIDQWTNWHRRENVWVIVPSEVLAVAGSYLLAYGAWLIFIRSRLKRSSRADTCAPDPDAPT